MLNTGVFLVAGVLLLAVTYFLFERRLPKALTLRLLEKPTADVGTTVRVGNDQIVPVSHLPAQFEDVALHSLLTQGATALLAVASIALALSWVVAGRALAPLHTVTATARRISRAPATDPALHERIALEGPEDEIKHLADTFDSMLERLDQAFDGQRRFVANASHELRTPLALKRALLELAAHRKSASPEIKELSDTLLTVNTRHERLIEGLLLLARSDSAMTDKSPLDLGAIACYVANTTEREAAEANVQLRTVTESAPTVGEAVLLERMVQNLAENAVRHNVAEGGWVDIATRRLDALGLVEVAVTNSGPVVPPYEVTRLFEPFQRMNNERVVTSRGVGLGLAIVRSIATAHGGTVWAEAREAGGLTVRIRMPLVPDVAETGPSPRRPRRPRRGDDHRTDGARLCERPGYSPPPYGVTRALAGLRAVP